MTCPVCAEPHAHEDRKTEGNKVIVTFFFSCGKKYQLVREGAVWKPTELAPCRNEIKPLK